MKQVKKNIILGTAANKVLAQPGRIYATLNPSVLKFLTARSSLSNGNKTMTHVGVGDSSAQSTICIADGTQVYFEVTCGTVTTLTSIGIGTETHENFDMPGRESAGLAYLNNGNKFSGGVQTAYGATYTNGDVIGVAVDLIANTIVFYKNGVSQGTAFSGLGTDPYWAMVGCDDNSPAVVLTVNFGESAFSGSVPSGHRSGIYTN